MPTRKILTAVLAVAMSHAAAQGVLAQQAPPVTLKIGDAAPALTVGKWLKGTPVTKFEAGKIYVVEFWATWCGPCKASIPHLTELAKKNPDVTFIGQDVWENDENDIEPFVKSMGDKMGYNVATDTKIGQDGAMATNWMMAAGRDGIPTAFIVGKDGKIAWIGHPMEMDPVLEKVKAGTYDVKAEGEKQAKVTDINQRLSAAVRAKDYDGAVKIADEMVAVKPDEADAIAVFQYRLLSRFGKADAARAKAVSIAKTAKDPEALNAVAWSLATQPAVTPDDLAVARQAIDRANDLTQNKLPQLLDTSARVYALDKAWDKAVDLQTKAVAAADGPMKAELQKTLDAYGKKELPAAATP